MITTTVDKIIELLSEKGSAEIKQIAKDLNAPAESVDAILSYLEEEGMIELKYGIMTTIASIKKVENKEEEAPLVKKVEEEAFVPKPTIVQKPEAVKRIEKPIPKSIPEEKPKPKLEAPKPAAKPAVQPLIPRLDESKGAKPEMETARLANMIISLLEKFNSMPKERQFEAVPALNKILGIGKEIKIYSRKDSASSEFILSSLLMSLHLIIKKYSRSKETSLAKKAEVTSSLISDISEKIGSERLGHYTKLIDDAKERLENEVYPFENLKKSVMSLISKKKKVNLKSIPKSVKSTKENVGEVLQVLSNEGAIEIKEGMLGSKLAVKKQAPKPIPKLQKKIELKPMVRAKVHELPKSSLPKPPEEEAEEIEEAELESHEDHMLPEAKPALKPLPKPKAEPRLATPMPKIKLQPAKIPVQPAPKPKAEKIKAEMPKPPVEKPKPIPPAVPAKIPKIGIKTIPRFNEMGGSKAERVNARLVNMIIGLLEKFHSLEEESHHDAVLLLNRILKMAKESKIYSVKDEISSEFILCSLLISMEILLSEYESTKEIGLARKLHSTYQLMKEMALKVDRKRIIYYKPLIEGIYSSIMRNVFSGISGDNQKISTMV